MANHEDDRLADTANPAGRAVVFGPFRLYPEQRLLVTNGKQMQIGSRALELLIALVEQPGELITKNDLIARVWPQTTVVEANLTVHISTLRRVLRDGQGGNRYIVNVTGRGYRFVAPVSLEALEAPPVNTSDRGPRHNLPAPLTQLIGRDETVATLAGLLAGQRMLTVVGPGGIGKTSVAFEVAERCSSSFTDGVWMVDLAPIEEPHLILVVLASVLGIEGRSANPLSDLLAALRNRRMLLIFDGCERLIDRVAAIADELLRNVPQLHVLATSREPLRIQGERIYRLATLPSPPPSPSLSAADAMAYPAVQLLVDRATANLDDFEMTDCDAPIVAEICRKLDGIPLAIELAAGRLDVYGVRGLAARLEDRLRLLTGGRRTALPRQQTMTATLDWSYTLLNATEQQVLSRLGIFPGSFTLDAAAAVVGDASTSERETIDGITDLVGKSLVTVEVSGPEPRLRLLETTRAYALGKLVERGDENAVAQRHAAYYRSLFAAASHDLGALANQLPASLERELDNIRTGLAWAFGTHGDMELAVGLAEASAPIFFKMSLLLECLNWTGKALEILNPDDRGTRREMVLRALEGLALMVSDGMASDAGASLVLAEDLAKRLDDAGYQQQILYGLWGYHLRCAEFRSAFEFAERIEEMAKRFPDHPATSAMANWTLGISQHFRGNHVDAHERLQLTTNRRPTELYRFDNVVIGNDPGVVATSLLSHVLWLLGMPEQARSHAAQCVAVARELNDPLSLCTALKWGGAAVPLRLGDIGTAERAVAELMDCAERHLLHSDYAGGLCLSGQLAQMRGDTATAISLLRDGLERMREARFNLQRTEFLSWLALAEMSSCHLDTAISLIAEAEQCATINDELWYMPEILRVRGELALISEPKNFGMADGYFTRSLDVAHRQQARSWELRTALSMARSQVRQNRKKDALSLLAKVYGGFTEGFESVDLQAAARLLAELR